MESPALNASDEQIALERRMAELGVERYWGEVRKLAASGRVSKTAPGRRLIRDACGALKDRLDLWLKESSGKHGAYDLLSSLAPEITSILTLQVMVDGASRGWTRARMQGAIGRALEDERLFLVMQKQHNPALERLKHLKLPASRAASLAREWSRRGVFDYDRLPGREALAAGVVCHTFAMETGLFTETKIQEKRRSQFVVSLTGEVHDWIIKGHERHEALRPIYLPMVDPPGEWAEGQIGGYRTTLARRRPLIRAQRRSHIDRLRGADLSEVYAGVNHIQNTAWEINDDVLQVANHLWELGGGRAGLPNTDQPDFPEKPEDEEELAEWRRVVRRNRKEWKRAGGSRVTTMRLLREAGDFSGRPIYFPHYLDWRGRAYPLPPFLQPQGNDLARGLLRFHNWCRVEKHSLEWEMWAAYGAKLYGHKGSQDELTNWIFEHTEEIEQTADDPLASSWWEDADEPFQFLAWAMEFGHHDDHSLVRVPLHLDGSNNGLQLYALLLRDPVLAEATNVACPNWKTADWDERFRRPEDIYQVVADRVTEQLKARLGWACQWDVSGEKPVSMNPEVRAAMEWMELLKSWGYDGLPRAATKRPVMTLPYGLKPYSCQRYIMTWLEEELRDRGTESPWGWATFDPCSFLADLVWTEIQAVAGRAQECMEWLHSLAELAAEKGLWWVAPNGLPVSQEYPKVARKRFKTVVADSVRWVRYLKHEQRTDLRRQRNGIAPNYVHSLDASLLTDLSVRLRDRGIELTTIHDSFGVLPEHAVTLRKQIQETAAELFSRDLLHELWEQVKLQLEDDVPPPPPRGDLDTRCVLQSDYFFS